MKIHCIVAARPNFMKVAPVHAALSAAGHAAVLIHTGQHYDAKMSQVFFDELGMPAPDINLNIGSASHAAQTARVMLAYEPLLLSHAPDLVLVAGDVNSTLAVALVAAKLGVPVAHLEAGLRSFDRGMPEEINRVVIDHVCDILLTPSADADAHLLREGIDARQIYRVGNAMIDSLRQHVAAAETKSRALLASLDVRAGSYALVTLHRPGNVDDPSTLRQLVVALGDIATRLPLIFPAHPRTRAQLASCGAPLPHGVRLIEPLGYLDFLALETHARLILTDSGGVQEESTALGVPCLTLRPNTERPVTVTEGTNTVVGLAPEAIVAAADDILQHGGKRGRIPELWDGATGPRVARAIADWGAGRGHQTAALA